MCSGGIDFDVVLLLLLLLCFINDFVLFVAVVLVVVVVFACLPVCLHCVLLGLLFSQVWVGFTGGGGGEDSCCLILCLFWGFLFVLGFFLTDLSFLQTTETLFKQQQTHKKTQHFLNIFITPPPPPPPSSGGIQYCGLFAYEPTEKRLAWICVLRA